ncbi:MAG TPA: Hsp33 family molecular chaperone HslO [Firmicutes bacterium]|nr:Hsp33 family molecular chaperone HslO [Bacillota bacterium]
MTAYKDHIIRATAAHGQIRAFAASTKNLAEYARSIHNASPVATIALGRLLTAAAMMGTMMKNNEDKLTVQIKGSGDFQSLTVTADRFGHVKGYPVPADVPFQSQGKDAFSLKKAFGKGTLTVMQDMGLKEPYVSQIPLQSGEIGEDLTYYYAKSEQTPTSVGLSVQLDGNGAVSYAGGFIVQLMPDADESIMDSMEIAVNNGGIFGGEAKDILDGILWEYDYEILDVINTSFQCDCSRERMEKALISLGPGELNAMIDEGEAIEVNCAFCNSHFQFTPEELKQLL